jgi:integrase
MRLFLRVCLTTACRKSDALGLRWHQVDLERTVAWLHDTRTVTRVPCRSSAT